MSIAKWSGSLLAWEKDLALRGCHRSAVAGQAPTALNALDPGNALYVCDKLDRRVGYGDNPISR